MSDPASVKLIVFDVDGVLTDGTIIVDDTGRESKRFHVRDGFAMRAAISVGVKVAVLTGRSSRAVTLRMMDLGIDLFLQGVHDKAAGLETLCRMAEVDPADTAYLGDDLIDLPAMRQCGYPMAVADASPPVREIAKYTTAQPGGHAAARDAIEHILKAQNLWDEVVKRYTGGPS